MLLRRVFLDVNINKLVTYLQPVFFLIKLKNKSVESREIKKKKIFYLNLKKKKNLNSTGVNIYLYTFVSANEICKFKDDFFFVLLLILRSNPQLSPKLLDVKERWGRGACSASESMKMNRFTTNQNFCAADTVERGHWRSTPEASRLT